MDSEKIGQLEEKIEQLDVKISRIEEYIELLQTSSNICTHPSNNEFKIQYRRWFDKSRGDSIPNIDEFINDPPCRAHFGDNIGAEHKDWEFWSWFEKSYSI
jgi:hypothetical protein